MFDSISNREVFLGAGEDFPVDGARLVARRVLAVIDEFDAVTVEGAAVPGGVHALNEHPCDKLDVFERAQDGGVEEAHRLFNSG